MKFTGERFISDSNLGIEMEIEHYHRYLSVEPVIKDKVVLDAACGTGYGSALMTKGAKFVYGIDISEEALDYAKEKYSISNLEFIHSSVDSIKLPDNCVDVVVSFETIEHINESSQNKFLAEVKRVLKDSGTLVISTPNKKIYSDIRDYQNEYHIREFYSHEFYSFIKKYFSYVKIYNQGFHLASSITDFTSSMELIKDNEEQTESRYIIAVCSNEESNSQISINTVKLNLQNYYVQNDTDLYSYINKMSYPRQYLYINYGEGFSEENKIEPSYYEFSENYFKSKFDLPSAKIVELRWDPLEGRIKQLQLSSIKFKTNDKEGYLGTNVLESNGINDGPNNFTFYNTDPFIVIKELPDGIQSIEFKGEFFDVSEIEIGNFINSINIENLELRNELEDTKNVYITNQICLEKQKEELQQEIFKMHDHIKQIHSEYDELLLANSVAFDKITELESDHNSILLAKEELIRSVAGLKIELEAVMNSRSWKLTRPLREGKWYLRSLIKRIVRTTYKLVPNRYKVKTKNFVYRNFKSIIGNTQMYKVWESTRNAESELLNRKSVSIEKQSANDFIKQIYDTPKQSHDYYVPFNNIKYDFHEDDIKLLAFYLPQFHPIKENDEWWGKGFTEWTNVTKAVPQFVGHYQPHLPGELGFYDLRLVEVMERQTELAKHYGISGFCFYHYWFSGERLLERPVDQLLENKHIDMPFCLCWANENWSRRWDGEESDVLMEQKYKDEDDLAFIDDLSKYLKDHRYIKINGKHLILVYRPALFPDFRKTSEVWRNYCRDKGIGEIFIMGVSWGIKRPEPFGLDGLVEFPPHSIHEYGSELINDRCNIINPDFKGLIFDYKKFVEDEKYLFNVDYELFKGVCPSWDNTARKPNNPTIYHNSSPDLYKEWLKKVIKYTKDSINGDKFVFVNAWNEWAEGAHLEPDRKYGYAYLEATRSALLEARSNVEKKIIYVSHDAHFNGAQLLSLNIIKNLKLNFGYEVEVLCINGGILLGEFSKYGNVTVLSEFKENAREIFESLYKKNYRSAICNTVITGEIGEELHRSGIKFISLIHELPGVIKQYAAENKAVKIAEYAEKVVFPSEYVKDKFENIVKVDKQKQTIIPQGLYKTNSFKNETNRAKVELRDKIKIPSSSYVVLGVGYADKRKGIDLFAKVASIVRKNDPNIYFVWVGNHEPDYISSISEELKSNIILLEATKEIDIYYAGADIYLMTSREDPFPSVVMESMSVGVPVIGFRDAGGFSDIVTEDTGILVDYLDTTQMAEAVLGLIRDNEIRVSKGNAGKMLIEEKFYFMDYIYKLLRLVGHTYHKVSVVVPNYNYSKYLPERLESINNQTYPIYEMIILDDHSTDNSVQYIGNFDTERSFRLKKIYNQINSGSVFKQWSLGLSKAEGNYIWIAEADDLSDPLFLEEVMKGFEKESNVVLSYSQSKQIDQDGRILANDYLDYTRDIDEEKWQNSYIQDGEKEIVEGLCIKNTIPNVSGVVFKKLNFSEILNTLLQYKIAGDWVFYIWLLKQGKISFSEKALNYHRRHYNSVTKSENNYNHYVEVVTVQDHIQGNFDIDENVKKKIEDYRVFLSDYLNVK